MNGGDKQKNRLTATFNYFLRRAGVCYNCGHFAKCKIASSDKKECNCFACPLTKPVLSAALGLSYWTIYNQIIRKGDAGVAEYLKRLRAKGVKVFSQGGIYFVKDFAKTIDDVPKPKSKGGKKNGKINQTTKDSPRT